MMNPLTALIGALVTLAVFSYLAKDNPAFRLVQQAALGAAVGMGIVIAWQQVLLPNWWSHIHNAFAGRERPTAALWLLALIPGSLWYFQLSRKWFWVSTLISGLFIGVAAGLTFKSRILLILPQIGASLKPLHPFAGPPGGDPPTVAACLNNLLLLFGMLAALLYFFFSIKTDHPVLRRSMRFGRLVIMVCLGAMFGNTVMTRMAYLIDRLHFLANAWVILRDWCQKLVGG